MITSAIMRAVWPRHTCKALQREFGLAPETARYWLYRGTPARRESEILARLEAEAEQRVAEWIAIHRQLREARSAGLGERLVGAAAAGAGGSARLARGAAGRLRAAARRLEEEG